jgi:hypothetical protein
MSRRLKTGEFKAHNCDACYACEVYSARLHEGSCPYKVCPFYGAWKEKRPYKKKMYKSPEPLPKVEKYDILAIMERHKKGMMACQIAEELGLKGQIVAELIRKEGEKYGILPNLPEMRG